MQKLLNIFDGLDVPDIIVECSSHQTKCFGTFMEDAIHRLEGFSPEEAPNWFKDLTEDYILSNLTVEAATQKSLGFD